MTKYILQIDKEVGLQVVQDDAGVPFEQLPDQAFALTALSEFERYRAARLLRQTSRRPNTRVTQLRHLIKEPFFTAGSKKDDPVQFCLEIYDVKSHDLKSQSAEVVLEYPAHPGGASSLFGWSALSLKSSQSEETVHATDQSIKQATSHQTEQDRAEVATTQAANCTETSSNTVSDNNAGVERVIFELDRQEISALLTLCRSLPQLSG